MECSYNIFLSYCITDYKIIGNKLQRFLAFINSSDILLSSIYKGINLYIFNNNGLILKFFKVDDDNFYIFIDNKISINNFFITEIN